MEGRGRWVSEFEASLIYRTSSRIARITQRDPVSRKKKKKERKRMKKKIQVGQRTTLSDWAEIKIYATNLKKSN